MKVCVIDDDPLMLEHLAEMVTGLGCQVVTASDVDTGLRLVESQGSDVAVVDILMPDRDGLTFIMEVRRSRPDLRIVAISGGGRLGAGSLLSMAGGLGANTTLVKPFSSSDLAQALGAPEPGPRASSI
ncbi:response regulator [Brevundimonas sp. NIBR11]|uniref:response regulator n=1 Tax=Brevundimonas sp. NIBR11 TaxID=3015999 RepID=UPI0022F10AF3|nr:response regulator [Brevundimonas sp. NIBR11]WGM31845.1 Photosynthetic apparatus regulatory protein RegA [Brevundimonas sp. NIBR11]